MASENTKTNVYAMIMFHECWSAKNADQSVLAQYHRMAARWAGLVVFLIAIYGGVSQRLSFDKKPAHTLVSAIHQISETPTANKPMQRYWSALFHGDEIALFKWSGGVGLSETPPFINFKTNSVLSVSLFMKLLTLSFTYGFFYGVFKLMASLFVEARHHKVEL